MSLKRSGRKLFDGTPLDFVQRLQDCHCTVSKLLDKYLRALPPKHFSFTPSHFLLSVFLLIHSYPPGRLGYSRHLSQQPFSQTHTHTVLLCYLSALQILTQVTWRRSNSVEPTTGACTKLPSSSENSFLWWQLLPPGQRQSYTPPTASPHFWLRLVPGKEGGRLGGRLGFRCDNRNARQAAALQEAGLSNPQVIL